MKALTLKTEITNAKEAVVERAREVSTTGQRNYINDLRNYGFEHLAKHHENKLIKESKEQEYRKTCDMILSDYSHFITNEDVDRIAKQYGLVIVEPKFYTGKIGPETLEKIKQVDLKKYAYYILCPIEMTKYYEDADKYIEMEKDPDPFLIVIPRNLLNKGKKWICAVVDEWGTDIGPERLKELKRLDKKHNNNQASEGDVKGPLIFLGVVIVTPITTLVTWWNTMSISDLIGMTIGFTFAAAFLTVILYENFFSDVVKYKPIESSKSKIWKKLRQESGIADTDFEVKIKERRAGAWR